MSVQSKLVSLTSRPARYLKVFSVLVLATFCMTALRTSVYSAAGIQRGAIRERIQERVQAKRGEAKETRRRNERPPSETRQIAGLKVAIWKPSVRTGSKAPLLAFSHGFKGCNIQSTYLMQQFADAGYLVVAPNHKDAICGGSGRGRPDEPGFREYEKWNETTYRDRADDMRKLLDGLRRDPLNSQIDWTRVGLVGHSLGGYTVLGLAGGWPSWKLSNVKAVLALSPVCEPYAMKGDLSGIRIPVMYQSGTRDLGVAPSLRKPGGCFAKNSSPATYVEFQGAGHFAWTDMQDTAQDLIDEYSVEFLNKYVRGVSSFSAAPVAKKAGVSDLKTK